MEHLLDYLLTVQRLKHTPRRGWAQAGVAGAESVAEHSFGVGVVAHLLARRAGADIGRCVELALVHDLAESLVGDITPGDGVPAPAKHAAEADAIADLGRRAGDPTLVDRWREYAEGVTAEAVLVRDANQIEMLVQALAIEEDTSTPPGALDRFWESAERRIQSDEGRELLAALRTRRSRP